MGLPAATTSFRRIPRRGGAMSPTIRRLPAPHATSAAVRGSRSRAEPRDEEAGGAVDVRQGEEELGAAGMAELGPRLAEGRVRLETRRVHEILVLGRIDRADRVKERAAGLHALCRRMQESELQLGERLGAPAQV